jgi:DNA-binding CsgD family transcriptional regulator
LSSEGAFKYDEQKDTIVVSDYFNTFFSNQKINYAIEDKFGNIWHYGNYTLGAKLIKPDGSYKDVTMPFKHLQGKFIEGFQYIYPLDANNYLISYENGFIHYNAEQPENQQKPFSLYLGNVELSKSDSSIFKGHLFTNNDNNIPSFNFKDNSIHFYYSAVHFENPYKVEFSTYLEGYDAEWSNWQIRYDREFTNLREGNYSFHIKARNVYGVETDTLRYSFYINPPWTRTNTAYFLYLLATLILISLLIFSIRKRIAFLKLREERLQKQKFIEREKELQKEALEAEKEIIRMRNDHLQEKIKHKDKELANSTMETIKKNKFLISLKTDMQKNNTEIKSLVAKANNKKLIRKIDNEINSENNWKVFETHFGNVHDDFLTKLKHQYPQISPAELRLCACLRMNISSKEIATLLNISLRGVEASRYRLRKALDLDRAINLTDFILSI